MFDAKQKWRRAKFICDVEGDMIHDGSAFQFIISRSTICLFAAGIHIAKTSTKAQLC